MVRQGHLFLSFQAFHKFDVCLQAFWWNVPGYVEESAKFGVLKSFLGNLAGLIVEVVGHF